MKMFKKSIIVGCLSFLMIGLTACQKPNANTEASKESELKDFVVTYVTSPLNVPSIVEKEKGIFQEALKDKNINVKYAEITSGADQTQALASNDVQMLYAVGGTSVILSAANDADIKILNMYSRSPEAFTMYAKDKTLTSPASLKGKTIAGPTGTNLHELLAAYLASGQLTIKDVNFVNMSIGDAKAGLENGSVDVALLAGAAAQQAKNQGYHLVTNGKGYISAIIAVAVKESVYQQHKDVFEKLSSAQQDILKFMKDNKEEALQMVAKKLDLELDAVKEMYQAYDFSLETSKEDIAGLQKTADFMYESKMIEQKLDVNKLFIQK